MVDLGVRKEENCIWGYAFQAEKHANAKAMR